MIQLTNSTLPVAAMYKDETHSNSHTTKLQNIYSYRLAFFLIASFCKQKTKLSIKNQH